MTAGAWLTCFVIATVVSLPLGEYFSYRLRQDAPDEHRWAGTPKSGSIIWRGPPHLGYISFIMSRRYVASLATLPRMRTLGEVLFWLHTGQIVTLLAAGFAHLSHDI
jgi:hypothetical protein